MRDSEGKHEDDCWADDARVGAAVFSSDDAKEGPRAFIEKRAGEVHGQLSTDPHLGACPAWLPGSRTSIFARVPGVFAGRSAVVFSYLVQPTKRREEMAAYAAARGWRFEAEQPLLVDRFTGPPFGARVRPACRTTCSTAATTAATWSRSTTSTRPRPPTGKQTDDHDVHRFSVLGLSMGVVAAAAERGPGELPRAVRRPAHRQRHRPRVRGLQPGVHRAAACGPEVRLRRPAPAAS